LLTTGFPEQFPEQYAPSATEEPNTLMIFCETAALADVACAKKARKATRSIIEASW
jgi:hypothetical protein